MIGHLCNSEFTSPLDLQSQCIRDLWVIFFPAFLAAVILLWKLLSLIKYPNSISKVLLTIQAPFTPFLTLRDAEFYSRLELTSDSRAAAQTARDGNGSKDTIPMAFKYSSQIIIVACVGLLETLARLAIGIYAIVHSSRTPLSQFLLVSTIPWIYTAIRPLLLTASTPPYSVFILNLVQLIGGIITLAGPFYDRYVFDSPFPSVWIFVGYSLHLVFTLVTLGAILLMPIGVPGPNVEREKIGSKISPEDYTRLWRWLTFRWIYPIVKNGTYNTLNESDIWELSPTMQSRAVFIRFTEIQRSTLLRRLWASNSMDIILDYFLTLVAVFFNYAGPFFLNRILAAVDVPSLEGPSTPSTRATLINAYVFAFLTLLASILKAQADVHHLWLGRRCSVRIGGQLRACIYDKALKRKDFSGITTKDSANANDGEIKGKAKGKQTSDSQGSNSSGADIGKIVQLMSGDSTRVATLISGLYNLYAAPFEIILAMTFLYSLLGISAFAGIIILVIASPLNHLLAKRAIKIQKGILAARDKRMSVLNELILAIKFIKFFAWEEKWMGRTMDAREHEIRWLVKARLNGLMMQFLWACVPVLVAIFAFASFVLMGNQLTISTAFTAIALFQMLRAPLNIIPNSIVTIIQTSVSLKRIEVFLQEPEVEDQISSLKCLVTPSAGIQTGDLDFSPLGIENASFRWNTVDKKPGDQAKKKNKTTPKNEGPDSPQPQAANSSPVADTERRFQLNDLNVVFPQGKLSLVTGPTASGKTALLMALLGEMTMTPESKAASGKVLLDKNPLRVGPNGYKHYLSYAAQTPWLQHSSIKDNILFGSPFEPDRYDQVLECCALKPDLAIFEDGDNTEIGVRGVSLSGGQKARVALARAVYARTQYVLLDDPLSAVDSHTARILFDKLLTGPLLANRTVVLVTHHVELVLPAAYYLVAMLDGRVEQQGKIEDLRADGSLNHITLDAKLLVTEEEKIETLQKPDADQAGTSKPKDSIETGSKRPRKLIEEEKRAEGAVKWNVYKTYLEASSYWTWSILLSLVFVTQGLTVVEKLWLKVWGEAYNSASTFQSWHLSPPLPLRMFGEKYSPLIDQSVLLPQFLPANANQFPIFASAIRTPSPFEHPLYYVAIYSGIGLSAVVIAILSSAIQITGGLRASRILFKRLLAAVVRATIRFHDTTPAGRMLNRFSKDMGIIDSQLASSLQRVNTTLATFFISLLTVSVITPLFLVPAIIIGYAYVKIGIGYLNSGRDLRRMESNTRSPIFTGFAELLDGLVTVRAFSAERRFLDNLFSKIDLTTQMWYTFWMTNRWLLLNYDFLGGVSVFTTMLMVLTSKMSAGFAGLAITSAMSFTNSIYWTCRVWTTLELDLNAVERVVEYLSLPQEPPARIESEHLPAYWPSSTSENPMVDIENLVIQYAPDLPSVLHGVSMKLHAKERVGIVGRTGSGKSTLAMAILRFVEPMGGSVRIDGIDVTSIGLYDLRSRLTFIPQDATLFSGSIKDNLDPFNEYTDEDCLDVLYRVHLLSKASPRESRAPSGNNSEGEEGSVSGSSTLVIAPSLSGEANKNEKEMIDLNTKVSAGGANFSQGQRQLLALARALLRQSPIIIMDEATSSIDFETDAKIQTTIREEFKNSLLLTIAHRLKTVIDYDRLVVLDQGRVIENDTPYNLIQNKNGAFYNMCLQSGTFEELKEAAIQRYRNTNP